MRSASIQAGLCGISKENCKLKAGEEQIRVLDKRVQDSTYPHSIFPGESPGACGRVFAWILANPIYKTSVLKSQVCTLLKAVLQSCISKNQGLITRPRSGTALHIKHPTSQRKEYNPIIVYITPFNVLKSAKREYKGVLIRVFSIFLKYIFLSLAKTSVKGG